MRLLSGCRQKGDCDITSTLKTAHRRQKHPVEMKPCCSSSPSEPTSKCLLKTSFFVGRTGSNLWQVYWRGIGGAAPPVTPTAFDATRAGAPTLRGGAAEAQRCRLRDRKRASDNSMDLSSDQNSHLRHRPPHQVFHLQVRRTDKLYHLII